LTQVPASSRKTSIEAKARFFFITDSRASVPGMRATTVRLSSDSFLKLGVMGEPEKVDDYSSRSDALNTPEAKQQHGKIHQPRYCHNQQQRDDENQPAGKPVHKTFRRFGPPPVRHQPGAGDARRVGDDRDRDDGGHDRDPPPPLLLGEISPRYG